MAVPVWGLRWGDGGPWLTPDGWLSTDVRDARVFPTSDRAHTFVAKTLIDMYPDGTWHIVPIDVDKETA